MSYLFQEGLWNYLKQAALQLGLGLVLSYETGLDSFDLQSEEFGVNPTNGEISTHIPEAWMSARAPHLYHS